MKATLFKFLLGIAILIGGFFEILYAENEPHKHHESGHQEEETLEWTKELLQKSSIELKSVSSGDISIEIELSGKIISYEPNVAHIIPRFSGVIREARKHLGETVTKGEVLAVVESNKSLNPYEVKSPITGVIVKQHSTVGEYVTATTNIYVVADLSKVWGEFYVFSDDFGKVNTGAHIAVMASALTEPVTSHVSFVSKVVDEHTQSKFIRTILDNSNGLLYSGAFAKSLVRIKTIKADILVEKNAIQRIEGHNVVFVWEDNNFTPRQVVTGKQDRHSIEIINGIRRGEVYATGNTFLIKAEFGKSEAEHEH